MVIPPTHSADCIDQEDFALSPAGRVVLFVRNTSVASLLAKLILAVIFPQKTIIREILSVRVIRDIRYPGRR